MLADDGELGEAFRVGCFVLITLPRVQIAAFFLGFPEEVFDVDLVEWQLRVASGETLATDLGDRQPRGHSIEVRLYAEDPEQNYLPQPGDVAAFVPASGPGLRWETGLDTADRMPSPARFATTRSVRRPL